MAWLVRDGEVLASLDVAETRTQRRRGLLGRDEFDGALYFPKTRSVHTFGMAFAIDVAFVDEHMTVQRVLTLPRWRIATSIRNTAGVIEASAGSFREWNLTCGDVLEIR